MSVESQIAALSSEARADAIDVGAQFSNPQVRNQVARSLAAFVQTGAELAVAGFVAEDAADLKELEPALNEAQAERQDADTTRIVGKRGYRNAVTSGKGAVRAAVTVLQNTASATERRPDSTNPLAPLRIAVALQKLGPVGRTGKKVLNQLEILEATFADEAVTKATANRGGPTTATAITTALAALNAAWPSHIQGGGTPAESQTLNLIEGIAVGLLRAMRKAARERSFQTGNPALAKAYELDLLYVNPPDKPDDKKEG